MARTRIPPDESEPIDDYFVDRPMDTPPEPVANQLVRVARGVLLLVLAAISFALFCLVGLLIGVL